MINFDFHFTGVNVGAHRLWSHRSFKAHIILRIFLMLCFTLASQLSVIWWVRDHRVHHKYTDTNGDPYTSKRGFLFSHGGWLLFKKHPDVVAAGKKIDLSDLWADPVLRFQKKFYVVLLLLISGALPTIIPFVFWQENLVISFICNTFRIILSFNSVGTVNSLAHMYGYKPYDQHMTPTNNWFAHQISQGEGWHNYHHVSWSDSSQILH
jgi:stearoyl-CoA desaturase (Delta-9 desaturase)